MIKYLVFLLYFFCFSKCFGQIKIDGGFSDWENLVRKSIELVEETDSTYYQTLMKNCRRISFWNGPYSTTEDKSIVISILDLKSESVNNIACVLVHESKHLELIQTKSLTQSEEECIAYRYELDFITKLKNPETYLKKNCLEYLSKFCD
jgi:hypothetical protein